MDGERRWTIRRLAGGDAQAYKEMRVEALSAHPAAFAQSAEVVVAQDLEYVAGLLEFAVTFGGFDGDESLVACATFVMPWSDQVKQRHKGQLVAMYVRPRMRGSGLADALVERVLQHAWARVEIVQLYVEAGNRAACRLYERHGFVVYGTERRALRIGNAYVDQHLMARALR